MFSLLNTQAEAYGQETFRCNNCNRDFDASIMTWVDVTKTPQIKNSLLKSEFNIIQCTHCGNRSFSGSAFFYEDFEEGLLVAVFPTIPDKRGEIESAIRAKYGYYPVLEFFYDMTQIWMLIYLQEHYKANSNLRSLSRLGEGEDRLRKVLKFLKENELMITIREKLTDALHGKTMNDELVELLGQAVYALEEMLPWPLDRRCVCGADIAHELTCCDEPIDIREHEPWLSRHYVIYCPHCKESLSGASCEQCGRIYTWKLGTVATYQTKQDASSQGIGRIESRPQSAPEPHAP